MVPDTADLVHHFAATMADTQLSQLSPRAIDAAKQTVLDTLGVSMAAGGLEASVTPVIDHVRGAGGRPEATVLGAGFRAPAEAAAFVNGALAHCLDFDDYTVWGHHAASSVVPAVFAVAERCGGVEGAELVTAVAVAQDIFARLRCNVTWRKDWNISPVVGVFAAAAACARVIGLGRDAIGHAMGIAGMSSAGTMEVVHGASDVRGVYAAFSARGAVTAALLAERGLSGVDGLFEGAHGFMTSYFRSGFDRATILDGLGETFLGEGTLYKPWPSVSTSHGHIYATMTAMAEAGLEPDQIAEIKAYVGDWHAVMCEPIEMRREPRTLLDARFSLPFLVGLAAVRGRIRVSDISKETLSDPDVLAVARKVVPVPDPSLDWDLSVPFGRIEILATDGRTLRAEGAGTPGSVDSPLDWPALTEKFVDCLSAAPPALSRERAEEIAERVQRLESMDDATEILEGLE